MDLNELRNQIDDLDEQLVTLLNKRAAVAQQVGAAKGQGVIFNPAREAQVISQAKKHSQGPLPDQAVEAIYREIISACLGLEQRLAVSYLGPIGTYSEEAARQRFGATADLQPCATIDETLLAAEKGTTNLAVLPIENSTEGAVNRTLDLLLQTPLVIVDEIMVPIHHQLLSQAKDLSDITEVAAHPQSLAQCRAWLNAYLPHVKQTAANSNADAAVQASKHVHMAAIAGKRAGETYNLPIMAANIEDDSSNTTRFVVVGGTPATASGHDKTSLLCSVPNVPGSLGKLIGLLAEHDINIIKLESRPTTSGLWDYVFYIDIEGHATDLTIAKALEQLRRQALFVKVLGAYPQAAAGAAA